MTRRTLKLATLMLGLNLGALAVVSVVLFVGTYLTAQRAVDMAMERTFAQRHKVAELLIRDCLNLIAGEVSVLAGQQATIEAVARRDKAVLERSLSSLYEHESDCHIDILFVADAQGRPWVDVSAARVSTQTIPARFVGTGQAEEAWRLVEGSGPGDPTAAFVTSRPVVSDWDGGLVGEVYAGILFNNNLALTRAIRRASGADTIGIVYRGQVIADSERRSSEALEVMRRTALDHPHGTISRSGDLLLAGRPLDVAGAGPALSIVQSFPNEAFAALRADYRNTAVVLVLAVLTAALLVVLVMRRATLPALGRLVAYANSVQSGARDARFRESTIEEFNGLGSALRDMVDKLSHNEQRYARLSELTQEGIVLFHEDRILDVNMSFCRLVDYTPGDLIGGSFSRLFGENTWPQAAQAMTRSDGGSAEGVLKRRMGLGFPVEISVRGLVYNGEHVLVASVRDITERKRARDVLQRQADIINQVHDAVVTIDLAGMVTFWNQGAERQFGYKATDVTGRSFFMLFPDDDRYRVQNEIMEPLRDRDFHESEVRMRSRAGLEFPAILSMTRQRDGDGRETGYVAFILDITDRKRAEDNLRKLSQAVEQSHASVVITDLEGRIEYVNPRFVEVTGYKAAEAIGRTNRMLRSGRTPPEVYSNLWATISAGKEWRGEFCNRAKSGDLFWEYATVSPITDDTGAITHYVGIKEDITVRKEYEERLLHQANFDDLTGLPNRVLALDRLGQAVASAHRESREMALMFVDLDQFKLINDTLGHDSGDKLLIEVGRRLQACVQEGDTVARVSGDEFLAILPTLSEAKMAESVAQRVLNAMSRPYVIGRQEIFVTASVGVAIYPADGTEPPVLMRNADAALYRAKEAGRNIYRFFKPEMNEHALERLLIETHLRHALDRDELLLHYQPVIDAETGAVVGAEALLRWQSPDFGMQPPDRFIPLAEDTGLILPIGEWVLGAACRQATRWRRDTGLPLRVSVNVSARQIAEPGLLEAVVRALDESGLPPDALDLEITERLLVEDRPETRVVLEDLRDKGVCLSIDDFGTGYSAIGYLKRFPFSTLKIDRSFISDVTRDPEDAALTTAIIALAHGLGLKVVAEGVETEAQMVFLRDQGCDSAQGYLFARPLSAEAFAQWLADHADAPPAVQAVPGAPSAGKP